MIIPNKHANSIFAISCDMYYSVFRFLFSVFAMRDVPLNIMYKGNNSCRTNYNHGNYTVN